ncbi:MAG: hypothetical protein O9264_12550 [Leptospira sp.]|nr:hypothetical protein [Leptospira sp.]
MNRLQKITIFFVILILSHSSLTAKAVLQVAFGVEENQLIIKSLDSTIAHLGDEDDKRIYNRILMHYLEFLELNMERNDDVSYERLRHTQRLLIPLYDRMIGKNISMLKLEMNRLGGISKDKEKASTKAMLRLGFRDITEAEHKLTMARNIRPALYLLKLREMLFALKILKHAGRFVVALGLQHDSENYRVTESNGFEEIDKEIDYAFVLKREKYKKIHWDNFFKVWNDAGIYSSVLKGDLKDDLSIPMNGVDPGYIRQPR